MSPTSSECHPCGFFNSFLVLSLKSLVPQISLEVRLETPPPGIPAWKEASHLGHRAFHVLKTRMNEVPFTSAWSLQNLSMGPPSSGSGACRLLRERWTPRANNFMLKPTLKPGHCSSFFKWTLQLHTSRKRSFLRHIKKISRDFLWALRRTLCLRRLPRSLCCLR